MRQEVLELKPVFSSVPEFLQEAVNRLHRMPEELLSQHPKFPALTPRRVQLMLDRWPNLPDNRKVAYEKFLSELKLTPLHIFRNIDIPNGHTIVAKKEYLRKGGNNFGLIYWPMFLENELKRSNPIDPDITPVIECSTGNANRAFVWTAKELGFKDIRSIIHRDAVPVRIERIQELGAEVIFSPAGLYARGYVDLLKELLRKD